MVEWMKEVGLPEPEYKEEMGGFSVYFYKDIYANTEKNLRKMGLNERQIRAVMYVKEKGSITNREYQEINNVSRQTATIDLSDLTEKEIFKHIGKAGKGIAYELTKLPNKRLIIGQNQHKDATKIILRYYCKIPGNKEIKLILEEINKKHNIKYEIIEGPYDREKDKQVYETYFKPRAKILKKRTGIPITKLRSKRAGNYFVSVPGTLAVFRNESVEWWCYTDSEIINFLKKILFEGIPFLEKLVSVI